MIDWNSLPDAPAATYDNVVASIESNNNPNAINPKSGAAGLYQFTKRTAQQYGLNDPTDPVQATGAFHQLTADNKAALSNVLGRDPTDPELYLAHQQGATGAAKLLNNPNTLASDIVGKNAVIFNGGNANMTAGDFANLVMNTYNHKAGSSLPQGTQYAQNNNIDWDALPDAKDNNIDWNSLPDAPAYGNQEKPNMVESGIQGASHGILPFGLGQNLMSALTASGTDAGMALMNATGHGKPGVTDKSWYDLFNEQNQQADNANAAAGEAHPNVYLGSDLAAGLLAPAAATALPEKLLGGSGESLLSKILTNPILEETETGGIGASNASTHGYVDPSILNAAIQTGEKQNVAYDAYNALVKSATATPAQISLAEDELLAANQARVAAYNAVQKAAESNPEGYNKLGLTLKDWSKVKTLNPFSNSGDIQKLGYGALAGQELLHWSVPGLREFAGGMYAANHALPWAVGNVAMNPLRVAVGANILSTATQAITNAKGGTGPFMSTENLPDLLPHLGQYGPILQNAAQQGGNDQLAATHFALQQTDPIYQQLYEESQNILF